MLKLHTLLHGVWTRHYTYTSVKEEYTSVRTVLYTDMSIKQRPMVGMPAKIHGCLHTRGAQLRQTTA